MAKRWVWLGLILIAGAGLLLYPREVAAALARSITDCLSTLAPTLFPFLALSSLMLRTGAGDLLARPLAPLCRWLRLPACSGPVLLLSLTGGYPAGARGVSLLFEQRRLTPSQAARLMLFCVNAGPAFVVSYAGSALLGDVRLGWLLLGAGNLSCLSLAAATALGAPRPEKASPIPVLPDPHPLVSSVADACRATWGLCGWVVFFAGITALLRCTGLLGAVNSLLTATGLLSSPQAGALTASLLEVTAGARAAAELAASPVLLAFALSFAGLCVHLQLFSFFPRFPGSKALFFLFRLLHGGLAALLTVLGLRLFPRAVPSVAGVPPVTGTGLAASWAGGASLLLLSVVFLLALARSRETPVAPGAEV